jgi:hypothetical protein
MNINSIKPRCDIEIKVLMKLVAQKPEEAKIL